MKRIWIDVEDLFEYAASNPRPSGIQRLAFELYLALNRRFDGTDTLRFVRHNRAGTGFSPVAWSAVRSLFEGLTASAPPPVTAPPPDPAASYFARDTPLHRLRRRLTHRLPIAVRQALVRFALAQVAALDALRALLREIWRAIRGHRAGDPASAQPAPDGDIAAEVAPGDVLMVLGAPWSHPSYDRLAARMRQAHGMRVALLVYDIIPLRRPEWCDRSLVRLFAAWFGAVLPLCDRLFAISRATAQDLERYARENALAIPLPVRPIPIGTGFSAEPPPDATLPSTYPAPGSYALVVSTIEARKNHALLVRAWRRLLEEMPPAEVPTLVFAGRVGWMVSDLMQQLRNTEFLGGKVVIIDDASDAQLAALYRGCRFTVFPSFYEGWGLPVTESLAFGKPCVISNATSLPEAGGALARYFDPDNLDDALRVIRDVIADPSGLEAWRQRVVREFRPVSWDATAEALIAGLA